MSGASLAAAALCVVTACAPSSCARHEPPSPHAEPAPSGTVASLVTVTTEGDGGPGARVEVAPSAGSWAEAVRAERWDEAWRLLEALPPATRALAETRYARARVAIERSDAKGAIAALEGLEAELPLLAGDVQRQRAEAQLEVGPYEVAGEWFLARGSATSLLKAAQAFEKAKLPARARAACDRVLASDKRTRAQEATARATRLRLAPADPAEADDARWLATRAPDLKIAKDADEALAKLAPGKPLTSDELLARAEALSLAGRPDDAVRSIEHAARAQGRKVGALEILRAKGDALYRGGKYETAARVLAQCAASGGPHVAEDAFRAARALARADKDDDAIAALQRVAKAHAATPSGDEAAFLIGKLELLHGRWAEAARSLDTYVAKYPNGQQRHEAARDRALARLLSGDAHGARPLFEQLAEDESDPLAAARARTMAALAALRDGDRTHAIARWTDVARARPLSWPALVARARLASIGAPLPPAVDAPEIADAGAAAPLLVALPPPVDLLHRVGLDEDAEGELREREASLAGAAQGRGVEALCAAYGALGRAKRRYQVAQQVSASLLAVAPTARTRWSWECAFPAPYPDDVSAREIENTLPTGILHAVMRQESGFDPEAVSPARAVGLLQLMPETARAVALEAAMPTDDDDARLTRPSRNIALGARYLHDLLERFHGVVPLAVAAYNGGPDAITRWLGRPKGLELDLFVERIPYAETRTYVARVMGNFARYGYLRAGEAGVPTIDLKLE